MDGDPSSTLPPSGTEPPPVDSGPVSPGATGTPSAPLAHLLTDEGLRTHQGLAKFKDVDSLAKSYIELDKLRNERSGVKPLTETATPEEIAAYRQAMGVPEKPEGYTWEAVDFPEEAAPTEAQLTAFRTMAHSLHLTPAQVQGIVQWYAKDLSQSWTAYNQGYDDTIRQSYDAVVKKYGAMAEPLRAAAEAYVRQRWGDAAVESLGPAPGKMWAVGNSPVLLDILIENARLTGHDQFVMADARGGLINKESAQQRYAEVMQQYYTTQDTGQKEALKHEAERLARVAFNT